MTLSLQPVRVANGSDEEGMLVFDEERRLLAVLTHLSDENEVAPGQWFLEAGFGPLDGGNKPTFADRTQPRLGSASASGKSGKRPLDGPTRVEPSERAQALLFSLKEARSGQKLTESLHLLADGGADRRSQASSKPLCPPP